MLNAKQRLLCAGLLSQHCPGKTGMTSDVCILYQILLSLEIASLLLEKQPTISSGLSVRSQTVDSRHGKAEISDALRAWRLHPQRHTELGSPLACKPCTATQHFTHSCYKMVKVLVK